MQRMHRGIPDYGCCVNIAKSKVNFDVEAANTANPVSAERGGERVGAEGGGSGGNGGENRWKTGGRNGGENGEGGRGGTRGNPAAMGQCPSVHQPYRPVLQPVPRYDLSDHIQDSGGERGETTNSDERGGGGDGGGESDGLPRCLPRRPPQPRPPKPLLEWCGLKFDADTGAFFANYGRYKGDNIRTSMTISSSSQHPGLDLKRRIARYEEELHYTLQPVDMIHPPPARPPALCPETRSDLTPELHFKRFHATLSGTCAPRCTPSSWTARSSQRRWSP